MLNSRQILITVFTLVSSTLSIAATYTVSKDGSGQFASIQEAVDAASYGDEVMILDTAVYEEQVTIDNTKNYLVLRSADPRSTSKPTILFQDRENVGPRTAEEALDYQYVTFDRNGALRVMDATGVIVEGVAVDGGGIFPFGGDGIWEGRYALQHGNIGINLFRSGETVIRNCDISNAFFGIQVKDRNEGGIYAIPNPADSDTDAVVPFSRFHGTGNHVIEYSRLHHNSFGCLFESCWDMGSTVRYNLFYENHHTTAIADDVKNMTSEGDNLGGGAFMFKDDILVPLAIHNNTFRHNGLIFCANWKVAAVHLVFNNVFAVPFEWWGQSDNVWGTFMELSTQFENRMNSCVYAAQQQEPVANYISIMNGMRNPDANGDLIPTTFPAAADIRYLHMDETMFISVDATSPDFLVPDWSNTLVAEYIIDKGWEEAGVKDPDGSRADLGAIPMGGGRPVDFITIRPTKPIIIDGDTATIGFNITPRIGTMTDLEVTYFGVVKDLDTTSDVFGSDGDPISTADIQQISLGTQTVQLGTNTIKVSVSGIGDFAFFEMVVEGTGSDGRKFTTSTGFIPYRKTDYRFEVALLDEGGNTISAVDTGKTVVLKVKPIRSNGTAFENTVDPTSITLFSGFPIGSPTGENVAFFPGGITDSAEVEVVFRHVPPGGYEYVRVAGTWVYSASMAAFLGSSGPIQVGPEKTAVIPQKLKKCRGRFVTCELVDLQGRLVARFTAGEGRGVLDEKIHTANLGRGLYLVLKRDAASGRILLSRRLYLAR